MHPEPSVVCPVLIGRSGPLSAALHTIDRARASHGGTLLVSGEAGIGKSRLTRATVERARELGFAALQGACFEADRAQPYAPLLDLVRGVAIVRVAGVGEPLLRSRGRRAGDALSRVAHRSSPRRSAAEARDPEEDRRRLFHDVTDSAARALGGAATARRGRGRALERRGDARPALAPVAAHRWRADGHRPHLSQRRGRVPGWRDSSPNWIVRASPRRCRCVRLARTRSPRCCRRSLDPSPTPGPAFVAALFERTEGNPFFLEEMLKALARLGRPGAGEGGMARRVRSTTS